MLTYPGQETPATKLRATFEEIWPTIHSWIEGFFWGALGFFRSLLAALFNTFTGKS